MCDVNPLKVRVCLSLCPSIPVVFSPPSHRETTSYLAKAPNFALNPHPAGYRAAYILYYIYSMPVLNKLVYFKRGRVGSIRPFSSSVRSCGKNPICIELQDPLCISTLY